MLHGVPRKKRPGKNMGQFTSLCIILAWGGAGPPSLYHSNFTLCCSQHKALALFCFLVLHLCVCVCVSGRGQGVALLHDFWDLSSLTKD